jgi:hypothetical protein
MHEALDLIPSTRKKEKGKGKQGKGGKGECGKGRQAKERGGEGREGEERGQGRKRTEIWNYKVFCFTYYTIFGESHFLETIIN